MPWERAEPRWCLQGQGTFQSTVRMKRSQGVQVGGFTMTHTHISWFCAVPTCWTHQKQLPWSGPGWAGCPQRAGLGGCSPCSCRCCILHWGSWAWRSRCAACSRRCRCSVHPETERKQNQSSPKCIQTKLTAMAPWREGVLGHPTAPPENRYLTWRQLCFIQPLWQPPGRNSLPLTLCPWGNVGVSPPWAWIKQGKQVRTIQHSPFWHAEHSRGQHIATGPETGGSSWMWWFSRLYQIWKRSAR